jgi:hypothetical protein
MEPAGRFEEDTLDSGSSQLTLLPPSELSAAAGIVQGVA